ncbi:MAG: SRPBCC domain-containing protein, partial [Bacteroidetes bacterium]|nr:SRPBCC domain-containing protein [Bacteroidota bacterium]
MNEIDQQDNVALRVSKNLNASVADVWNAWTNPEEIAKWWLPEGFSESAPSEVYLRVGG